VSRKIEKHRNANCSYMDEGVRLLELAQKAASLYERQEMLEKRRLLSFVFSNWTWRGGRLTPNYRQPFDMLAVANMAHQKQKATEVFQPQFRNLAPQVGPSGQHGDLCFRLLSACTGWYVNTHSRKATYAWQV
jgi:hypothetical protein